MMNTLENYKKLSLFNLQQTLDKMQNLIIYMGERKVEDKEKIVSGLHSINDSLIKLRETSEKFQEQVRKITAEGLTDATQAQLNDRIIKAKAYFEKELDEKVNNELQKLNKELQQQNKVRKLLKEMKSFMDFFEHFTNRYRLQPKQREEIFVQPSAASLNQPQFSDENSQYLFGLLKQIRRQFAGEENIAPFMVCHDASLKEMATYLPLTLNDMAMIKGMGDRSLKKYGETFLTAILSKIS